MFILEIKKADGSSYWTEHFNDKESLDKWLAEEKTRPYWDKTFAETIIDMSPTPAEKAARDKVLKDMKDKEVVKRQVAQDLKKLKSGDMKTLIDLEATLLKVIDILV